MPILVSMLFLIMEQKSNTNEQPNDESESVRPAGTLALKSNSEIRSSKLQNSTAEITNMFKRIEVQVENDVSGVLLSIKEAHSSSTESKSIDFAAFLSRAVAGHIPGMV